MSRAIKLVLKQVNVTYTKENTTVHAVKDIDLTVYQGEIFGIVGLSGAGKSTLIRTLNGLQKPSSGQILIDQEDIVPQKGKTLRQTRQKIGMIFQQFNLITNRTVAQNLLFALKASHYPKEKREARVRELLQLVDLEEKYAAYPNELSGGQKQRIGIARALINDPEILLCDEATSALDVETTEEILKLLKEINQRLNLTIVFITHELEVAHRLFDRMAVMENGEIVELAETYHLFATPKHKLTKRLVGRYFDLDFPEELDQQLSTGTLIELRYQGTFALEPLISEISKQFPVTISIVHGKIEYIKGQAIGILLVHLQAETKYKASVLEVLADRVAQCTIIKEVA